MKLESTPTTNPPPTPEEAAVQKLRVTLVAVLANPKAVLADYFEGWRAWADAALKGTDPIIFRNLRPTPAPICCAVCRSTYNIAIPGGALLQGCLECNYQKIRHSWFVTDWHVQTMANYLRAPLWLLRQILCEEIAKQAKELCNVGSFWHSSDPSQLEIAFTQQPQLTAFLSTEVPNLQADSPS